MLVPLAFAWGGMDEARFAYDDAILVTAASGLVLWAGGRRFKRELQPRDGFLLVTLVWTVLPAFATLPLMLYLPGLSFTDAYFEAMSAFTATGATVFTQLEMLPLSINVWRCFLQMVGGLGIIVLVVAVLPLLGVGGSQLFKAETPGPMKEAKLTPRIAETARGLWVVYFVLSAACMLAYRAAGMSWADAFMHSCATVGLGGFSSYDNGFGHWNSPLLDTVAMVFMLLAGINFARYFVVWRTRSLRPLLTCTEARWYLGWIAATIAVIAVYLSVNRTFSDPWQMLRHVSFHVVSLATTTGFVSADYEQWPLFAPVLMFMLGCFASCAGSTGGGIKMVRMILLLKQAQHELVRIVHPRVVNPVLLNGQVVPQTVLAAVLAYMLIYGGSLIGLTLLLLLSGLDLVTAFSAIVACVNNIGPGLGEVGPSVNFQGLTDYQTWICTFGMLLGRLELLTVMVLFTPQFWRK
ncbi:potassium transporter TrkG [Aquincola sp. MAHUQ-54]|uniref:Trk system potassium uptake protein n=1 Tax=Aquincola agrisoli TaxID=3119538 RepID=A0AAW9QG65_9BURK